MTKKVMIGTPCYDGRIDVWYVNSLTNTIKLAPQYDVEITPMWVSFDALLQRARNDTIHIALETEVDDLIFIDSDIEWQPEWFFKLLEYPHDIVGGTYPKKGDREEYVTRQIIKRPITGGSDLIEVDGLGTGFVKLSRRALQYLWKSSKPYIDPKDNKERRMICDVVIENGSMISEDINMFNKLVRGGFKVYLDTSMTCNHTGPKKFTGNYSNWYKNFLKNYHTPDKQI
jgi:glycosyltransferase involved in cell wall biosynthesis